MAYPHFRLTFHEPAKGGKPRVVKADVIEFIAPDGTTTDVSACVSRCDVVSDVGKPRTLRLEVVYFEVEVARAES